MCSVTAVQIGIMVVGAAMTARAQRQQGKHADAVGEYNARVGENQAQEVRNQAIQGENEERQKARQLQSKQRTQFAARGALVDTGTAADVQEDTKLMGDINAARIRGNAESQAMALEQGATLTRSEGAFQKSAGDNAAFATVVSTGGKVANKWYTHNATQPTAKPPTAKPPLKVNALGGR